VLVGTLRHHFRDLPDTVGRWFHVNLEVSAPAGGYRCAVDVDSKQSSTGVQWRTLRVRPADLGPVAALAEGYHDLGRVAESGAVDYVRHPALRVRAGCLGLPAGEAAARRAWHAGSNVDAAEALERILRVDTRILVVGEPFHGGGLGMHNVHQNQGDPAGSQWWSENGIWQDGATVVARPDGWLDVFLSKFSTQAYRTDADGHPVT
jgi:hypothetical protein